MKSCGSGTVLNFHMILLRKWKALKCQTLGAAVHVIGLVCWLEIDHCLVTVSYLPSVFCFVSACVKFAHEFLTLFERLVQLIFSFPSWFHTIWFYCSHAFQSFLSQITLCFWSKDSIAFTGLPSYRYRNFTLRAYLCWGHTYSLTANDEWSNSQRTSLLFSHSQTLREATSLPSENKLSGCYPCGQSSKFQIHTHARFTRSKKWPTRTKPYQQSIFRKNRLKFSTFILRWESYYRLWHE